MLKRWLSFLLAMVLVLGLCSCDRLPNIDLIPDKTTKTTATTGTPAGTDPTDPRYILIVGNSHSVDAFWLLYQAYMDQYPGTDLCVGILHYGGACIDEHVKFAENKDEVIRYYRNNSGKWDIQYGVTTEFVLKDQPWDTILMQPAKEDLADDTLNKKGRHALAKIIDQYVDHPYKLMWHISWPSPNDETFFSPDYVRQPPTGYKEKLTRLYGFNPVTQYSLMLKQTRKNILNDKIYDQAVCSGASVMHAHLAQGFSQLDLWRDYTHLSDYGRLMVGYALVAQFTGKPIQKVGINRITVGWRHKQNKEFGPLDLTDEMKQGIIRGANYALKSPWELPKK